MSIYEFKQKFSKARFFASARSYNDLLEFVHILGTVAETKTAMVNQLQEKVLMLEKKYFDAVIRDPKTGRYIKSPTTSPENMP